MRRRRHPRAFTLIELMAVLIIVGVLLLAIVPSLDGFVPKYRLRSGARKVASVVEYAQSTAVGRRKEYAVAYDLDQSTYWMVLPPEEEEDEAQQQDASGQGGGLFDFGGGQGEKPAGRPRDDIEHGLPPPDPDAAGQQQLDAAPDLVDRESLKPRRLPTGVEFERVIVGDRDETTGRIYVTFSHLGNAGSHVVGVRLADQEDRQVWLKFNALTRSLEYYDEQPELRTLQGEGGGSGQGGGFQ